ncbi:MAG: aminotransferase class IV [Acidobacteria bacterium]|nr:aminotransferase class IV [Acidobacteriota bacterium]
MHPLISYNHTLMSIEEVSISPINAGLLHGYGVFTTLRIYNGIPFQFKEHWTRLEMHAHMIKLHLDEDIETQIHADLISLIDANNLLEGKSRITLLERQSPFWQLGEKKIGVDVLIFTADLQPKSIELNLTISPYRILSSPLSGVKTTAYIPQLLMLEEARVRGFDDAIVLNERGEISEVTTANIFWIRHKVLYTPTLSTGCLAGTTSGLIRKLAREMKIESTTGAFHVEHLLSAEECFVTSSTREIVRVKSINNKHFEAMPNSIFERLTIAFKKYVHKTTYPR